MSARSAWPIANNTGVALILAVALPGIANGRGATELQERDQRGQLRERRRRQLHARSGLHLAIFTAGVLDAILMSNFHGLVRPGVMIGLALIVLILAATARRSAFPTGS